MPGAHAGHRSNLDPMPTCACPHRPPLCHIFLLSLHSSYRAKPVAEWPRDACAVWSIESGGLNDEAETTPHVAVGPRAPPHAGTVSPC